MAEVVRADAPPREVQYPPDFDHTSDVSNEGRPRESAGAGREAAHPGNPALNRSAEVVGRGLGTAVAEVKRLPRQVDRLRSRIYLAGESTASAVAELRGAAEARASHLRDAAEVGLLELADKAAVYTSAAGSRSGRARRLSRLALRRLDALRHDLRRRIAVVGRWQQEEPLRVILVGASAGFAIGIILRIWRRNRG